MISKPARVIFGVLFLCLGVVLAGGVFAYLALQDRPPSRLSDSGYHLRRTKVFFYPGFGFSSPFEIIGVDRASFEVLDHSYARDDSRVYLDGVAIPEADPSTFKLLSPPFALDARHVYVNRDIFSDDPGHFEQVEGNLSRDSQYIYWSTSVVSDDPTHLSVFQSSGYYTFFKDSKAVFVNGNPIAEADPTSFAVIADAYSRDAAHVYYFDEMILDADVSTFEILESPYARDADSVFWMAHIIPEASPETFRVLNANFECSADAHYAFYQDEMIRDFDPEKIPAAAQVTGCSSTEVHFTP
jgi:hypothetical protein